jgi:two-component system chemotaxis response regulator CheY
MTARIFIVDDERTVVETLREILVMNGFDILGWAYSGEEAVRKYASFIPPPDIVIMDYRLPAKNGMEAMAEILKLDPSARVLFVSADMTARSIALAGGAVGFILKPFGMREFLATVQTLVSKDAS